MAFIVKNVNQLDDTTMTNSADNALNLEQTPSEQELELELDESTSVETQGSDPLDAIEDVEELRVIARGHAKKLRAISERKAKAEEISKDDSKDEFVKKSDLQLSNQKQAIRSATIPTENDSEEVQKQKTDMLDNWEEVRKYYTPRRGKSTQEDILEDIKDAYAVFNTRRPQVEETEEGEVSKADITKTVKTVSGDNTKVPKTKAKDPKNFKLPEGPETWYE